MTIPYELEKKLYKILLLVGIFIVIYALLWIFVSLGLIPGTLLAVFPPIIMLIVGVYVIYIAYNRR